MNVNIIKKRGNARKGFQSRKNLKRGRPHGFNALDLGALLKTVALMF
jgi:hypothetical protein